jgi:CGNR zinc finger
VCGQDRHQESQAEQFGDRNDDKHGRAAPRSVTPEEIRGTRTGRGSRREEDRHQHGSRIQRYGLLARSGISDERAVAEFKEARQARELLYALFLDRVQCPGERCGWLFLDTTKRGNPRWCSMSECGQEAKNLNRRTTSSLCHGKIMLR